jgi:hypothetical protein
LHCVFLFAGLLTKETACLIPVLCVGYSMMQKRENKFLNPVYFIWIIPLAAYFILRMNFSGGISLNLLLNPSNIKNNIYMVADYLSVAFMLSKDEVYPEIKILTFLKGFAILTVFFVSALLSKHKRQSLFFLSFSIIFLMPNFLIDRALFQGNRMYLPAAFLITSAFYIAMPLYKKYKSAVTAAALLFIFTTAVTANNRMPIFENSETFFAASDNFSKMKPYLLLGYKILSYLKFYNQADETVQLLKKKDMLDEETVHNLIFINMQLVNYEEIIKLALNYGQYLSKDKDYYDMLIFCYTKTGNPQEAERMRNFSEKTP